MYELSDYLKTIAISLGVSLLIAFGIYHFLPFGIVDLNSDSVLGATSITTINATDKIKDSRTTINDNFTSLNYNKIEIATTSLPNITTLAGLTTANALNSASSLTTIGTIGTGIWNGTAIGVGYGGTGTTSPTQYLVMLGDGSNGLVVASSTGTSGQFLTSNGAGAYPSWQSSSVNLSDNYMWTGMHIFNGSTEIASSSQASTTIDIGHITNWATASSSITNKGFVDKNDFQVFLKPNAASDSDANVSYSATGDFGTLSFTDNTNAYGRWTLEVPVGATDIETIRIISLEETTGDVYLNPAVSIFSMVTDASITSDSAGAAAYAIAGSGTTVNVINVPSTAWDGLTITDKSLIGFEIFRDGDNGSDTYNNNWSVLGVEIIFK